ncbi:MAG: MG2 domain-containing protein, partial [Acetobacteraceae bacterium]
ETASRLAPDDADLKRDLVTREQEFGLLVRKVRTEPESFPARACVAFIGRPGGAADFHPGDWVTLTPPIKAAAVTLESGQICITGLQPGTRTQVSFAQGMPGADGMRLKQPASLAIAMPDRQPRLVFAADRFLQPGGAPATVTLASVNLSKVTLHLLLVSERALQPFLANHPLGSTDFDLTSLRDSAREVWTGSAEIPGFTRNALMHTVLPLPPELGKPGLYVLLARPDDGTPSDGSSPQAVQTLLRTDLAPTIWRGDDGLTVQVRGYASAEPKAGVRIALVAADNDVLSTEATGADGVARFTPALLHGTAGLAPASLHLTGPDGDFSMLDLTAPAFDLSDRGVSGRPQPGPLDAFVWLDRGIYRPGETVHAMALLRDAAGRPADVPLHVVVTRPGGQVFSDTVPARADDAAMVAPIVLSGGAQAGTWTIALRVTPDSPPIAEKTFEVDAFVPARLAVDIDKPTAPLPPGRITAIPLSVRFLYGAPGSSLSGSGALHLAADPTPFAGFDGYRFGIQDEAIASDTSNFDLPETDAQGKTTLPIGLTHLPDATQALQAEVTATINDPAGRPVSATATVPVRPAGPLIGIRSSLPAGAVDPGQEAGFDIVAVDPQGGRIAMPARYTLVRQTPDWRLIVRQGVASYETIWRDEPVASGSADITPVAARHLAWRLGFGRYKLQLVQTGRGLAAASTVFDVGWGGSGNPDAPPRVKVSLDHAAYKQGDTALVHIEAPFAGPATLLVLTNRVHTLRDIEVPAGGTDVEVPVGADWGAGAYIAVHVFRPTEKALPDRAIGVAWLQIDPSARSLPVAFEAPAVLRPRGPATITVHTAPGAWLTLAAVDEGVLRLTGFASPDPVAHFFGRRALGVDIHDEFGRLLRPAEGTPTVLHQGGGGDEGAAPPIPQIVVSLFTPPVQAGADGIARISLQLPDFDGQLRLMAVAWSSDMVGGASEDVLVRDKLIAEALLPRFLAPGDTARLGVLLQNVELPAGAVSVHVTASGALALAGPDHLEANLASQARTVALTQLHANAAGEGRVALDVTGPDGFTAHHEASISVHPARGRIVVASSAEIVPGAQGTIAPDASAFLPGTWRATLSINGTVRYAAAALVQALLDYPLNCLEQLTSRGLPLAMLPDSALGVPDRAGRLEQTVEAVLDHQRYDGAFGLWSANGEAEPWLTAYAIEFLLRARQAGAVVPPTSLASALNWLTGEIAHPPESKDGFAAQSYAVYVLTLAGQAPAGAIRVMASAEDALPTPLARAQIAASLARLAQAGPAAALFHAVLAAPARRNWSADYGSALRDQFATAMLIKESGIDKTALAGIVATLPGADLDPAALNTQEQAWGAAAAAALGAGAPPLAVTVDGHAVPAGASASMALTAPVTLRNEGTAAVSRTVSVSGVPSVAPPTSRHLMQVRRYFYTLGGQAIDPDKLAQNTVFVMVIEGKAEDGQALQAIVLAGLPAGWEIAGRLAGGKVPGMDWLGELS